MYICQDYKNAENGPYRMASPGISQFQMRAEGRWPSTDSIADELGQSPLPLIPMEITLKAGKCLVRANLSTTCLEENGRKKQEQKSLH